MKRNVILYIAMSLDGYIAKPNDDLDFLSIVEQEGEDYGYHDFLRSTDTVIVGRRTYDWVMGKVTEFPHADQRTFVITRSPRASIGSIQFYTGDLKALIHDLKQQDGKDIFIDGGAMLVNALLEDHLIDQIILSIIPILVGNGTRLFHDGRPEQQFELMSVKSFERGLVQLHYKRKL